MALARDGKVYVSDRANQRIQAFTRAGRYLGQVFVNRNTASLRTVSGMSFSQDHAQRYIFAADISNGSLVVIDRRKLAAVARAARGAGRPLELTTPHLIATDEQGRYLVSEVTARRVRRLARLPG